MPFDANGNWIPVEGAWDNYRKKKDSAPSSADASVSSSPATSEPDTTTPTAAQQLSNALGQYQNNGVYGPPAPASYIVSEPDTTQSTQQPDIPEPTPAPTPAPNDTIQAYKPSFWEKAKDTLSSIFGNNGEIHNTIRAGANELAKDMLPINLLPGVKETQDNITQEDLQNISPTTAKALNLAGEGLGLLAGGEVAAPVKAIEGLNALNETKTAAGALKAALPAVEKTAAEKLLTTGANAAIIGAGEQALQGLSTPNIDNRNLPQELGAGVHRWSGDMLNTAGYGAKMLGFDNLGDNLVSLGEQQNKGYDSNAAQVKDWSTFLSPKYWAATLGENLPTTLAFMPLALAGQAVGGAGAAALGMERLGPKLGPFAGAVMESLGAGIATTPLEASMEASNSYEDVYKQALADGKTQEEAHKLGAEAGKKDFWGNMALLGITNSAEFADAFMPKGLKGIMERAGLDSSAARVAGTALSEGGEEVAQQYIQNRSEGKPTDFTSPDMFAQFATGALMGGAFGAAGSMDSHMEKAQNSLYSIQNRVLEKLPDDMKTDVQGAMKDAQAAGIPDDQAKAAILDQIAQMPEGQQIIHDAVNDVKTSLQVEQENQGGTSAQNVQSVEQGSVEPATFNPGDKVMVNAPGFGEKKVKSVEGSIIHFTDGSQAGQALVSPIEQSAASSNVTEAPVTPSEIQTSNVSTEALQAQNAQEAAPTLSKEQATANLKTAKDALAKFERGLMSDAYFLSTGTVPQEKLSEANRLQDEVNKAQDAVDLFNPKAPEQKQPEPQQQAPAAETKAAYAPGDVVNLKGKGNQKFTVTDVLPGGYFSLKSEKGGDIPKVHEKAMSPVTESAAAEQQSANPASKTTKSNEPKFTGTDIAYGLAKQTANIQGNTVTVTSKAKNYDNERMPAGYDASVDKSLSHSFNLSDYEKAISSHGNPAYAKSQFIKKQIGFDSLGEKLDHHPMMDHIVDAQVRAVDRAIKAQQELGGQQEQSQQENNPAPKSEPQQVEQPQQETATEPSKEEQTTSNNIEGFTTREGKHTKTGEKLWIVNPAERLSKDDFSKLRTKMGKMGGHWSNFKPNVGFLFKEDPTEKLQAAFGESKSASEPQQVQTNEHNAKQKIEGGNENGAESNRPADQGSVAEEQSGNVPANATERKPAKNTGIDAGASNERVGESNGGTATKEPGNAGNELPGQSAETGSSEGTSVGTGKGNDNRPAAEPADTTGGQQHSRPAADFVITDELDSLGGAKTKFKNNVAAIRLVHQIMQEDRPAMPEEQAVLARYVGWGGLPQAFDEKNDTYRADPQWQKEYRELRDLVKEGIITEEQYKDMRASTLNAHYTAPGVVRAMYEALQRMGFKGGRVLEPSMGIGNFFGLMPKEMSAKSQRVGVELDSLTGQIASLLYPKAAVNIKGFEQYKVGDNYFDLAIGNVPFGDIKIVDNTYKGKFAFVTQRIHNYFFIKSLDKVRPGGIIMFITSSGTLNAKGNYLIRRLIGDKANFVGAVRLPGDAFKANAGTEVTTDIIVLQKRAEGEEAKHAGPFFNTVDSSFIGMEGKPLPDNEYFVQHPDMVFGQYVEDKLHPGRLGVKANEGDFETTLREGLAKLPENIYQDRAATPKEVKAPEISNNINDFRQYDQYNYFLSGSKIMQRVGDQAMEVQVTGKEADRIRGMIPLREKAKELVKLMQSHSATDAQIKQSQKELNKLYDDFVKRHGFLNDDANKRAMIDDVIGSGMLQALEKVEKTGRKITSTKEDIFSKRTIKASQPVDQVGTSEEALVLSLFERGKVDFEHMSKLTGKSENELIDELSGSIFENPQGTWETADEYLSGNVRNKLVIAKEAAAKDPKYEENVKALEAVQPELLEASQISVRLGATWIPTTDIKAFIDEFLGQNNSGVGVRYNPISAKWSINGTHLVYNAKNFDEYGVRAKKGRDKTALDLIEDSLNLQTSRVTYTDSEGKTYVDAEATNEAQNKQKQIQAIFQDWIFSDEARSKRLVEKYNQEFNSIRLREYNGELIYGTDKEPRTIPGLIQTFKLRPHQKNAVWRILQGGNTLLAHVVGAGKTAEMIVGALEMRRLGIANKPLIAVPHNLVDQWYRDVLKLYPGAKVLKISSDDIPGVKVIRPKSMTDAEYQKRVNENRINRAAALNKIALGNYDIILISHVSFNKMPVSPELVQEHIQEQVQEVEIALKNLAEDGAKKNDRTVKELEKIKKNLEARMKANLDEESKDVAIPFEQLGIDQVFVDEAHMFKNLKFHTKMSNVAGLPQTHSKRAEDMFLKTQWLTKQRGGGGVIFATGTPISNTMAEMFTMQRYLQMPALKDLGLSHFDAWAAQFGETVTGIEMDATGKFKQKTRFARFHNLPELMSQFRSTADIQTADMLDLPRPKYIERETVVSPMSDLQADYLQGLVKRAEDIKNGRVDPTQDNYLKLTGDGRKMALDIRLVDPASKEDYAEGKVNKAVENIVKIYSDKEIAKDKEGNPIDNATQLVFLDLGTPKKKTEKENENSDEQPDTKLDDEERSSIGIYDELKAKLIRNGIPQDQIAFIHDAKTGPAKEQLFQKVRDGKVRILIGSTEKMGAGMNVQDRLVALHHLDAPWRPSDVEQREGRIIRQGNANDTVHIFNYVTEGSFDAIMWDTLKRKATFIAQVMNGKANVRSAEDVEEMVMGFAQIAAVASGNPLIMKKFEIDQKVLDLTMLKTAYERNKRRLQQQISALPAQINKYESTANRLIVDLAARQDTKGDAFKVVIDGKVFDKREDAGQKLIDLYNEKYVSLLHGEREKVGSFGGFDLYMVKAEKIDFMLEGPSGINGLSNKDYGFLVNKESALGTATRLDNAATKEDIQGNIDRYTEWANRDQKQLQDYQKLANKPFEQEKELREAVDEQTRITKELTATDEQKVAETAVDDSNNDGELAFAATPVGGNKRPSRSRKQPESQPVPETNPETEQTTPDEKPVKELIDSTLHIGPRVTRQVTRLIAKFLNTPIRDITQRASAEGLFNPKTGAGSVRKRSIGEWRVVGHELGHAFSSIYGPQGANSELASLAERMYPGKLPKGKEHEEGFAEFFYLWTLDPATAEGEAPLSFKKMNEFIAKDAELTELFNKVRTIIDNDLQASPYAKGMGAISSEINPSPEVPAEYRVPWYQRGIYRYLDFTIPAKAMMKALNEEDRSKTLDLAKQLATSGDAKAKALMDFEHAPRDHEGRFIEGRSLLSIANDAIDTIAKKYPTKIQYAALNEKMGAKDIFSTILLAMRVRERYATGKFDKLPLSKVEAENIIAQAIKDFPDVLRVNAKGEYEGHAVDYARTLSSLILEKLERADVITAEDRLAIEKGSDFYMPFYYDERKRPATSGTNESGRTNKSPVKRFTGKDAPVLDFFQATMLKLTEVEQAIEYRRVLDTLTSILDKEDMGPFGSKIANPMKMLNINSQAAFEQVMEQLTRKVGDLIDSPTNISDVLENQSIQIFTANGFNGISKSEPVIMIKRNGTPVFYRISPDLFDMLMSMKPVQLDGFNKILARLSRISRFTSLATTRFITNTFARDIAASFIQSKNQPHQLVKNTLQAVSTVIGLNEEINQAYVMSGAMSGAAEHILRDAVRNNFDDGILHTPASGWGYVMTGGKKSLVRLIRTPSEALRVMEEGPRMNEWIATWKAEVKKLGFDPEEMWKTFIDKGTDALPVSLQNQMERILLDAAFNSREVTVNFGLHGTSEGIRKIMRTVPFLGGSTQGIYRFARLAKEDPKRFMIGIGSLSLMSAIVFALMMQSDDDKKWLEDLDSAARDRYWWIPMGNGLHYGLAKPYEYALVANMVERYLDHTHSNVKGARKTFEDWTTAVADAFGVTVLSPVLQTWLDLERGEDSQGFKIVPESQQTLAKDLQVSPTTSIFAKISATVINKTARLFAELGGSPGNPNAGVSPRQVDYFIKGMIGQYGATTLGLIDRVVDKATGKPSPSTKGLEYAPVVGSVLYGQAEGTSRIVEKFYSDYSKAQTLSQSAAALIKQKNTALPAWATKDNIQLIGYLPAMQAISKDLSSIRKTYSQAKEQAATPEQRRKLTMQQDYIEKLGASLLYGVTPEAPNADSGITEKQIQAVIDRFKADAQKALNSESKRPGGSSDSAKYLTILYQKASK
jgi:N12 class adenine-specific DNA methylase